MKQVQVVGLIGLIIFSSIFLYCFRQIIKYFASTNDYKTKIYEQIKFRFHIIYAINALLECVSALSQLLDSEYSRWGYIPHLLGLYVNLVTFVNVIFMWNHVLASQNLIQVKWQFYVAFLSVNLVSTLLEVGLYAYYGNIAVEDYTMLQRMDGFVANALYVLSLFVTSILILVIAEKLKRKLDSSGSGSVSSRGSGSVPSAARSTRKLLRKINACVLVCLLSYTMRIYFIGRLTVMWMLTGDEPGFSQYSKLWWQVLTYWIPTLTPGFLFLYIMRPHIATESTSERVSDKHQMTASLSTSPISDQEQYYNYDLEDNVTSDTEQQEAILEDSVGSPIHQSIDSNSNQSRDLAVSYDNNGFSERITFYSKDGNDLKMSNF
jgi:hypothetical protein